MTVSAKTSLDRVIESVRSYVPGATDTVLKHELFNVLDDFLRETTLWRERIRIPLAAGKTEFEFEAQDSNSEITTMVAIENVNGFPVQAYMPSPGIVKLDRARSNAEVAYATVALTVTQRVSSTTGYPEVPDWVVAQHRQVLTDGLIARLLLQPAKPYTNLDLGRYHARLFRTGKSKARLGAVNGGLYGGQAWTYPQNFATGRRR